MTGRGKMGDSTAASMGALAAKDLRTRQSLRLREPESLHHGAFSFLDGMVLSAMHLMTGSER